MNDINNNEIEKENSEDLTITSKELELVKSVLPKSQYLLTLKYTEGEEGDWYKKKIKQLAETVENAPKLYATDGAKEHQIVLHYFHPTGTESFVTEIGKDGEAYGFQCLNNNWEKAEWGNLDLNEIKDIPGMEVDYYIEDGISVERYLEKLGVYKTGVQLDDEVDFSTSSEVSNVSSENLISVTNEEWNALSHLADNAKMDWFYEDTYKQEKLSKNDLEDLSTAYITENLYKLSEEERKLVNDVFSRAEIKIFNKAEEEKALERLEEESKIEDRKNQIKKELKETEKNIELIVHDDEPDKIHICRTVEIGGRTIYVQEGEVYPDENGNTKIVASARDFYNWANTKEKLKEYHEILLSEKIEKKIEEHDNGVEQARNEVESKESVEKSDINYFIRTFAPHEKTKTNLTADEVVKIYIDSQKAKIGGQIGINIKDDVVFDDPNALGVPVFFYSEASEKDSFELFGKDFIVQLKENNKHSKDVLKAFSDLYDAAKKAGLSVEDAPYIAEKRKELFEDKSENNLQELLIKALETDSEKLPIVDYSYQNYDVLFSQGYVETPIETLKMGNNQFQKFNKPDRDYLLAAAYKTLTTPSLIFDSMSLDTKDGESKPVRVYGKSFYRENSDKSRAVESVVIFREGNNIVIGTHNKDFSRFVKQIKTAEQIIYADKTVSRLCELVNNGLVYVRTEGENAQSLNPKYNESNLLSIEKLIQDNRLSTNGLLKVVKNGQTYVMQDRNELSDFFKKQNTQLNNVHLFNSVTNPWFVKLSEKQKEFVLSDMQINPDFIGEYQDELERKQQSYEVNSKPTKEWLLEKIDQRNWEGEYSYFNENDAGQKRHYAEVFLEESLREAREQKDSKNIATNYVLEKLKAAGIEVITDKEEFDRILQHEEILQKMTSDLSEFESLTKRIEEQEAKTKELNSQKQNLTEQKDEIQRQRYNDYVSFANEISKFLPEANIEPFQKFRTVSNKVPTFDTTKNKNGWYLVKNKGSLMFLTEDNVGDCTEVPIEIEKYDPDWHPKVNVIKICSDKNSIDLLKENLKSFLENQLTLEQQKQNKLITEVGNLKTNLLKNSLDKSSIESDFAKLDNSLRFNANFEIESKNLNDKVSVFPGSTGKSGLGIRHIIEERFKKDNLSQDEITALTALILESVKDGKITRESDYQAEFTKNGIVAIVRKNYFGEEQNWILTGFAYDESDLEKNREATEAIKTVIANYSNSDGYSYFRSQVGAVITSLDSNISQNTNKSTLQKMTGAKIKKAPAEMVTLYMRVSKSASASDNNLEANTNTVNNEQLYVEENQVYGFTFENKIYLNPELMNSNVAVHEYTHLWDEYTRRTNPELWNKGKDILKNTYLWNEIKNSPDYADIANNEDLLASEVHSRICGEIAQSVLERIAKENGEITKDAVIDWDKEVQNYLEEELGLYKGNFGKVFVVNEIRSWFAQPMKDLMNGRDISVEMPKEQKEKTIEEETKKSYSWNEIIENSMGKGNGDIENAIYNTAREKIAEYAKQYGIDVESDGISPEDVIDSFVEEHKEVSFDKDGNIIVDEQKRIIGSETNVQDSSVSIPTQTPESERLEESISKNENDENNTHFDIYSEEFISKFGDWEKANRIEKLKAAPSLEKSESVVINGDDKSFLIQNYREAKNTKELREIAKEIGKSIKGNYLNKDLNVDISVSMSNIDEIKNHHIIEKGHIEAIQYIPEIIKTGIFISEENNEDKEKHPNIEKYKYLVTGIKIGDTDYTCKSAIAVDKGGKHYYDQRLSEIEKGLLLDNLSQLMSRGKSEQSLTNYDKRLLRICQVPQFPYLEKKYGEWQPTVETAKKVMNGTLFVEKDENGVQILHDTEKKIVIGQELSDFLKEASHGESVEKKSYSWNEIYENAMGKGFGDAENAVYNTAREKITEYAKQYGVDVESDGISPEDVIDSFVEEHKEVSFDKDGDIIIDEKLREEIPELKTYHTLKKEDVENLEIISDEDFSDIVDSIILNDYKHIPNVIRLPNIKNELAEKLGLEKDAAFIMKKSATHIRPDRKGSYGQAFDTEEYRKIPEVLRDADFAVVDKYLQNFQVVFDDENDNSKINKIIFNKDEIGNYLVTIGKVDRESAFSEERNTVVAVGVAPTIQTLKTRASSTTLRASQTTVTENISQNEELSMKEKQSTFDNEIDDLVAGKLESGHVFNLGEPSEILQKCGFLKDQKIELAEARLRMKATQGNHPFDLEDVKGLDKALQEPVGVFEYGNKEKSRNVIVNLQKDGKNFLVGVFFDQNRNGLTVSSIRGLFNRDNIDWIRWIQQGKMIYGNKEKIQVLITQQRTNLADVNNKEVRTSSDSYYLDSTENIMQKFGDVNDVFTSEFPKYAEQKERYKIYRAFNQIYQNLESVEREDAVIQADEFYDALVNNDTKKIELYESGLLYNDIADKAKEIHKKFEREKNISLKSTEESVAKKDTSRIFTFAMEIKKVLKISGMEATDENIGRVAKYVLSKNEFLRKDVLNVMKDNNCNSPENTMKFLRRIYEERFSEIKLNFPEKIKTKDVVRNKTNQQENDFSISD